MATNKNMHVWCSWEPELRDQNKTEQRLLFLSNYMHKDKIGATALPQTFSHKYSFIHVCDTKELLGLEASKKKNYFTNTKE